MGIFFCLKKAFGIVMSCFGVILALSIGILNCLCPPTYSSNCKFSMLYAVNLNTYI